MLIYDWSSDLCSSVLLQEAFELARITSGLSDSVLRHQYESISHMLAPHVIRAIADRTIGIDYLEGWVEQPRGVLSGNKIRLRAFGARCVNVIAGNAPGTSGQTRVWNRTERRSVGKGGGSKFRS